MNHNISEHERDHAPLEPTLRRVLSPFERFTRVQGLSGFVLIIAAAAALIVANSDY